jgi:hypothetical protein
VATARLCSSWRCFYTLESGQIAAALGPTVRQAPVAHFAQKAQHLKYRNKIFKNYLAEKNGTKNIYSFLQAEIVLVSNKEKKKN